MGVWIAVAVGGAIGSVARHAVNHVVHSYWLTTRFPIGTAMINVTGCFVIGLLTGLIASNRLVLRFHWREFVFVGVLGGYTTFSTFGLDTHTLFQTHSSHAAAAYVAASTIGSLTAVWLGYAIGLRAA